MDKVAMYKEEIYKMAAINPKYKKMIASFANRNRAGLANKLNPNPREFMKQRGHALEGNIAELRRQVGRDKVKIIRDMDRMEGSTHVIAKADTVQKGYLGKKEFSNRRPDSAEIHLPSKNINKAKLRIRDLVTGGKLDKKTSKEMRFYVANHELGNELPESMKTSLNPKEFELWKKKNSGSFNVHFSPDHSAVPFMTGSHISPKVLIEDGRAARKLSKKTRKILSIVPKSSNTGFSSNGNGGYTRSDSFANNLNLDFDSIIKPSSLKEVGQQAKKRMNKQMPVTENRFMNEAIPGKSLRKNMAKSHFDTTYNKAQEKSLMSKALNANIDDLSDFEANDIVNSHMNTNWKTTWKNKNKR